MYVCFLSSTVHNPSCQRLSTRLHRRRQNIKNIRIWALVVVVLSWLDYILPHFVCSTGRKNGYSVDGNQELMAIGKIHKVDTNWIICHSVVVVTSVLVFPFVKTTRPWVFISNILFLFVFRQRLTYVWTLRQLVLFLVFFFINFYPRDAVLARVFAIAMCLSVCLSVCPSAARRYCA